MNVKFNVKTKIRFNGQEYASVEAMPAEVRQVYEQALAKAQVQRSTKVVFNGQAYASLEEMPADLRSQYEQVMVMLDKDHDGIPDMLETGQPVAVAPASDSSTLVEAAPLASNSKPAPESKSRAMATILIGVLVLVVVAVLLILIKTGLH
jgi:hypothetical protein